MITNKKIQERNGEDRESYSPKTVFNTNGCVGIFSQYLSEIRIYMTKRWLRFNFIKLKPLLGE